MNEARRIYVVGGSNVDIIYHVPRMPSEHEKLRTAASAIMGGGSSGNTACWLAHLGHSVLMITGIADDMFADFLLGSFAEHRVDVAFGVVSLVLGPAWLRSFHAGRTRRW